MKKSSWHGPVTDKISISDLASMLGLPDFDQIDELNTDYVWDSGNAAYKESIRDGESESKAEKARERAEGLAQVEVFGKWHSGVMNAADHLFGEHHLQLSPVSAKKALGTEFKISPKTTWDAALKQIIETINGVGMFHFSSVREFLQSGPYATARIGVLTHLSHIKDYPRVYGGTSAQRLFDRSW